MSVSNFNDEAVLDQYIIDLLSDDEEEENDQNNKRDRDGMDSDDETLPDEHIGCYSPKPSSISYTQESSDDENEQPPMKKSKTIEKPKPKKYKKRTPLTQNIHGYYGCTCYDEHKRNRTTKVDPDGDKRPMGFKWGSRPGDSQILYYQSNLKIELRVCLTCYHGSISDMNLNLNSGLEFKVIKMSFYHVRKLVDSMKEAKRVLEKGVSASDIQKALMELSEEERESDLITSDELIRRIVAFAEKVLNVDFIQLLNTRSFNSIMQLPNLKLGQEKFEEFINENEELIGFNWVDLKSLKRTL